MTSEGSLPHSQETATSSETLRNVSYRGMFWCEELLTPFLKWNLEEYLLSAVRCCLHNVLAVTVYIGSPFLRLQHEDAPCCVMGPTHEGFNNWNTCEIFPQKTPEIPSKSSSSTTIEQQGTYWCVMSAGVNLQRLRVTNISSETHKSSYLYFDN